MATYLQAPAKKWLFITTCVMLAMAFVPILGLLNYLLMVPVFFILCFDMLQSKTKAYRWVLGFLFLFASVIITTVVSFAQMFTGPRV